MLNMNELESTLCGLIDNFASLSHEEKEMVLDEISLIDETCSVIVSAHKAIETTPSFESKIESKVENKDNFKISGIKL